MTEDILDDALGESPDETGGMKTTFLRKMVEAFFEYKKIILVVVVSLVALISLGAGIWMFFFKGKSEELRKPVVISEAVMPETSLTREAVFEDIVVLEPFERIQLKETSAMGLITLHLSLELTDLQYRNQVYAMQDRIRKIVTDQLEEMTWLVLRSPEGKIRLKYSLLKRVNSIFSKPAVGNIYFTYFIMQ